MTGPSPRRVAIAEGLVAGLRLARHPGVAAFLLFEVLGSVNLWAPISTIYLLGRGLSLSQVAMLEALYRITGLAVEVPTGMLSDRIGHRRALALGTLLYAAVMGIIVLSASLWAFMLAWVLWAMAMALNSGADAAFLYEATDEAAQELTTRGESVEGAYRKAWSLGDVLSLAAMALGSIVAGVLYTHGRLLPFAVDGVLALIAASVIYLLGGRRHRQASVRLSLAGTPIEKPERPPFSARLAMLRVEVSRWEVTRYLLLSGIGVMLVWGHLFLLQPYLLGADCSVATIGIVYASCQIAGALGAMTGAVGGAKHITLLHMATRYLPLLWLLHAPMSVLSPKLAIAALVCAWATFYFFEARLAELLHEMIDSTHRATIVSLGALINSLMMLAATTTAGFVSDATNLRVGSATILCLAAAAFLAVLIADSRVRRRRLRAPDAAYTDALRTHDAA